MTIGTGLYLSSLPLVVSLVIPNPSPSFYCVHVDTYHSLYLILLLHEHEE